VAESQVRVVVQINMLDFQGDKESQFQSTVARCEKARLEPGCLGYEAYRSSAHPDLVTILELWDSMRSYDGHWQKSLRERPGAGRPTEPGQPSTQVEFYHFAPFEHGDGFWQPADVAHRCDSIRWP
jgi:quinol monooxygenase YgiN